MSCQIAIDSSPENINRRSPLLAPRRGNKANVGECVGSTAAECGSVCCCFPFVVLEIVFLAVYKVPMTVFRRIWRRRLTIKKKSKGNCSGRLSTVNSFSDDGFRGDFSFNRCSIDGSDLDRAMWERFDSTGFGRSLSQRHVFFPID